MCRKEGHGGFFLQGPSLSSCVYVQYEITKDRNVPCESRFPGRACAAGRKQLSGLLLSEWGNSNVPSTVHHKIAITRCPDGSGE